MDETKKIRYNILGILETKKEIPLTVSSLSQAHIYLGPRKSGSTSGIVGFIVASQMPHRLEKTTESVLYKP